MRGYIYKILVLIPVLLILNSSLLIQKPDAQWMQMSNGMGTNKDVLSFTADGNDIFAGTDGYGVFLSTNNGTSWTQIGLSNSSVCSLAKFDNIIFAGTWDGGGLFLSTDNGINWIQSELFTAYSFARLGNKFLAGTDNGVFLSTNYGTSWSLIGLEENTIWSLAVLGNNIFAGTYPPHLHPGGVFISTDDGESWTQTDLHNKFVVSFAILNDNIFAASNWGVYFSTNNGTSWTLVGLNNSAVSSLAISGNNIFAGTTYDDSNGVYLSTNNGVSWIQKDEGFNFIPEVDALVITNNFIFAGTYGNSVWRRGLSDILTSGQRVSILVPESYFLHQNYPNPFNPTTKIKFDVAVDSRLRRNDKVVLMVFDILGKEVETLVNEQLSPGTYSVDWNASAFPSGVYFYRLTTDGFSETKKMLMIK